MMGVDEVDHYYCFKKIYQIRNCKMNSISNQPSLVRERTIVPTDETVFFKQLDSTKILK